MSDWDDFCESERLGNGETAFDNFEKWLNNMNELFDNGWKTYDPDQPDIDDCDDTFIPCDGCPGFIGYQCCQNQGDECGDYLADCADIGADEDIDDSE